MDNKIVDKLAYIKMICDW